MLEPAGGGAVTYRVFEDIDGMGPGGDTLVGTGLMVNNYSYAVKTLANYITATYTVRACNTAGCSAPSSSVAVNPNWAITMMKASNSGRGTNFGSGSALSDDGNTLVVGAAGESSNASGVNGDQTNTSLTSAGAVYVFTRTNGVWAQQAYLKAATPRDTGYFGGGVSLSGDGNTLAVGAGQYLSGMVRGSETGTHIFKRTGGAWTQEAYLPRAISNPGASVSLSRSGDVLAVGVPGISNSYPSGYSYGAAYLYARTGTSWTQQARVALPAGSGSGLFARWVKLSGDGSTLAVAAPELNRYTGAVYIYAATGVAWNLQTQLVAGNADEDDEFGTSLALTDDGNMLVVGAKHESSNARGLNGDQSNNLASGSGAAYVYTRTGSTWSEQAYLKASNADSGDYFGIGVALSRTGDTLVVTAPSEASNSFGVTGNPQDNSATDSRGQTGAAYVFTRTGTSWVEKSYLKAFIGNNGGTAKGFGSGVSISGDGKTIAVEAWNENTNGAGINGTGTGGTYYTGPSSGSVYVY